jgi:hypothetical protein
MEQLFGLSTDRFGNLVNCWGIAPDHTAATCCERRSAQRLSQLHSGSPQSYQIHVRYRVHTMFVCDLRELIYLCAAPLLRLRLGVDLGVQHCHFLKNQRQPSRLASSHIEIGPPLGHQLAMTIGCDSYLRQHA